MADLVIQIGASARQFQEELDKVNEKTADLRAHLETATKASAVAFGVLSAAIGASVYEFGQAEKISNTTNAILEATGGIAGVTAQDVEKLGESLAKLTSFSDESVKAAENVFLGFTKIHKETFPKATAAALDLAVKMGVDAPQAAEVLGKALQRPTEALGLLQRNGITFTETQKKQIEFFEKSGQSAKAQELILKQLGATIGGLAQKELNTLSGSLAHLKNNFGEIAEQIGGTFAPPFRAAIKIADDFVTSIKDSPRLLTAISVAIGSAAVAAGSFTFIALGAGAFIKLQGALELASLAMAAFRIQLTAVQIASVIGAAAAAASIAYLVYEKTREKSKQVEEAKGEDTKKIAEQTQKDIAAGEDAARKRKNALEAQDRSFKQQAASLEVQDALNQNETILAISKQFLETKKAIEEQDRLEGELRRGEIYSANAAAEIANAEAIKNRLKATLADLTTIQQEAFADDAAQEEQFAIQIQEAARTSDDKKFINKKTHYESLKKEHAKSILTETQAERAYLSADLADNIANYNTKLVETQKYGKTYAELNSLMHSNEYNAAKNTGQQLVALTQSRNETLKTIGKAAAITNIITQTAQAAMSIFAGWSTIPYVGYALGIAGAAAAVAFGAEQVGTVLGANQGGVYSGGIAGRDSIPALYTHGELVVPEQNFEEVINAVAVSRSNESGGSSSGAVAQGTSTVKVELELVGELSQIVTAKQIEDRNLGVARDA